MVRPACDEAKRLWDGDRMQYQGRKIFLLNLDTVYALSVPVSRGVDDSFPVSYQHTLESIP